MARQTAPKQVLQGRCIFCQEQVAKNKMTQHLKSCRARLASIDKSEGEKQRLFHIQVEGKYRPAYWMHLEIPASAHLADLDSFLRYTWLECCDHLSEFEIGGETYSYLPEDDWGMGGFTILGEDEEDEEAEEAQMPGMQEIASEMTRQLSLEFGTELKNVQPALIEKKLEELFAANMPPGMSVSALPVLRPLLAQMAESLQQGTLAQDLEALEEEEEDEGGMQSELGDVLEIGQKFSYVYDFGSSSTLSLRLIDEREGALPEILEEEEDKAEEEDEFEEEVFENEEEEVRIQVMARNEPPALVCHICGKPATRVPSASEYDSLAEIALCPTHAAQSDYPDELLPIVNSPRTGICGYDGNLYEEDEEDEEEWDEEDEEDEEE